MKPITLVTLIASLAACGGLQPAKASPEADNIKSRIGRYQLLEARPPYPALILDTATGCVEALYVVPEGGAKATFQSMKMSDGTEFTPTPSIVPASRAGSVMRAGIIGQSREQCQLSPPIAEGRKPSK